MLQIILPWWEFSFAVFIPRRCLLQIVITYREDTFKNAFSITLLTKAMVFHCKATNTGSNGKKIIDEKYPKGIANAENSIAKQYRTHTGEFDVIFPEGFESNTQVDIFT
jgi:hypothetical protein